MNNRAHQNDMENFIPYTCIPILIRIIVPFLFPNFVQSVSYRPEVSTPISSYKRLKEGLFLFHIGLDPYDGGTFHQPPLLLLIYALIPEVLHVFLPTLLDISVAYCLFHIAKYRKSFLESEIWEKGELTIIEEEFEFEDSEETKELNEGLRKRKSSQHKKKEILSSLQDNFTDNNFTDKTIPPKDTLNPSLVALLYLSNPLSIFSCFGGSTSIWGSAGLVAAVHFACLGTNLFEATAKYQPLFAIYVLIALTTILKTYPSIGDMGISFGFVTLFPELFRCNYMIRFNLFLNFKDANGIYVSSLLLISCSCLLPAFHHLWLYSGSGNSNFYYAITLVCSVGQIGWVNDITTAMIKREGCRIGGRGIWRRYSVETSIE
ncbi:hypothetical protein HK099_007308 [Clydaea vesicula]|uniref:Uncharacterized protein n=1 Tax=Clydaea vesicula TaxID=447962 RepID=A0AAD5UBY3_9FUNG|nr:hypothetical protein HK099_007308 [Clydaea vesicula]